MKWFKCDVITPKTKKDRLGNWRETGEWNLIRETKARYSPWFTAGSLIQERDVTKADRYITLPLSLNTLPASFYLRAGGVVYKVTEKKHWEGRWTICRVVNYDADRNYKGHDNADT